MSKSSYFAVLLLLAISLTCHGYEGDPICCTNENEHYECGSACQTTCATLGEPCPIVNVRCNDDCYCDEGYARDDSGKCIPIEDCPPKKEVCCPENEHYEACGSPCQTTCDTLYEKCIIIPIRCSDGCYCNEGFARDYRGICIPIQECPPKRVCKPFEHFEKCGSPCQRTCKTLNEECPMISCTCNEACYCDDGYARDENGRCVSISECRPIDGNRCRKNEYFSAEPCQITCENVGKGCPSNCTRNVFDCYCIDGYARDCNYKCIPIWQCPQFSGPTECGRNAHFKCGSPCQKECATLDKPCRDYRSPCIEKCFCNEGYARDENGQCIPIERCPLFSSESDSFSGSCSKKSSSSSSSSSESDSKFESCEAPKTSFLNINGILSGLFKK